ncbi:hypothetical protein M3221_13565 [Domibacillus indicus]|uniref:hypothetical protein n=1 Tax=Domibacillus indicus TaxID=1437523 RepID=UPI00203A4F78|nr:hypothetical protein [Domibacillus indicus]MCM3789428.1 hypothetical protein [Domibacillus indicus]
MNYLTANELKSTYYKKADSMDAGDVNMYLGRANGYAYSVIGGMPVFSDTLPEDTLKVAVAMAFEIFAEGQEAETNPVNGNITEAAPPGHYVRKADNPFDLVEKMLRPYAEKVDLQKEAENPPIQDNGMMFL